LHVDEIQQNLLFYLFWNSGAKPQKVRGWTILIKILFVWRKTRNLSKNKVVWRKKTIFQSQRGDNPLNPTPVLCLCFGTYTTKKLNKSARKNARATNQATILDETIFCAPQNFIIPNNAEQMTTARIEPTLRTVYHINSCYECKIQQQQQLPPGWFGFYTRSTAG
jgi:hypothetical protein